MKRTGIYGGSFNPIHIGHTQLAQALIESRMVDELWLLVSPQNPLKANQQLLDDEERLHLASIAAEGIEGLCVSDFEFRMPRPSYMVNTLAAMRTQYPDREFILVIGADNWERFPQWYHSEEILAQHQLIIYPRPGYKLENLPSNVIVTDTPLLEISSTEIRENINKPDYNGEGLLPAVWEEIKKRGLYK